MAGRILPIALATVAGISIGVATFDGEFKKQQLKRLQEEYEQEVAAVPSSKSAGPPPTASNMVPCPLPEKLPVKTAEVEASASSASTWSSMIGLWAWNKDGDDVAATTKQAPAKTIVGEVKGKP